MEGDAVELIRVDYFQDPGYVEWEVQPLRSGSAVIRSIGIPPCRPGTPCPEERFEVTVTVLR